MRKTPFSLGSCATSNPPFAQVRADVAQQRQALVVGEVVQETHAEHDVELAIELEVDDVGTVEVDVVEAERVGATPCLEDRFLGEIDSHEAIRLARDHHFELSPTAAEAEHVSEAPGPRLAQQP